MSKNRKRTNKRNTLVDIAVLTAGVIEPALFGKCLSAIKREMESIPSELYIFHNGSVPETRREYDELMEQAGATVLRNNQDIGFPAGANRVIRRGTSPLVLFISDDIILHEGTLEKLVRRMDDPTIGICGLKLTFPDDSQDAGRPAGRVQHIGHAVNVRGDIIHPLLGWSKNNPKCNISREVQSVTGAVFLVRRRVFQKAGGFFEGYGRGYFEDVDLNLTIRGLGYKVFIDTECTATHYVGATFIKKNQPTNMEVNRMILLQRKGRQLFNDAFAFW